MVPRRIAALAAVLALIAPAAAFAQSAGDEQYQDPFGGDEQSQDDGSQSPDTPTSSDDTGSGTTTTTQTPAPTGAEPAATAAQASPAAEQLPRTGGDVVLPAVAGFWLLLGGVALRAQVRLHDRGA
jgi:hypothetical protein